MFDLKCGDYTIRFNLDNGLYVYDTNGAICKTYMIHLLESVSEEIENDVCVLTYDSRNTDEFIINLLTSKSYKVIVIDRSDLYYSKEVANTLSILSNNSIILVDLKNTMLASKMTIMSAGIVVDEKRNFEVYWK